MNNRIADLRKNYLKLTQAEFAKRLNLSQSAVGNYESGSRSVNDRTIADICRVFNVNETWLRTGEGDPFEEKNQDAELAEFFGRVMNSDASDSVKTLMLALSELDPKYWDKVEEMIRTLVDITKSK